MNEYLPILIVGAIIGGFAIAFIAAFLTVRKHAKNNGFERHMKDKELVYRLIKYAVPYWKEFLLVLVIMIVSVVYDVVSPLLVGHIQDTIKGDFEVPYLLQMVAVYGLILLISLGSTYAQTIILQKVGQKILSQLRQDIFTHIESLSHHQLSEIPVGKLVTRVCNDTNAISMMFTGILVTMVKNCMVIVGVLGAMLLLNYALTLMVMCFVSEPISLHSSSLTILTII